MAIGSSYSDLQSAKDRNKAIDEGRSRMFLQALLNAKPRARQFEMQQAGAEQPQCLP